MISGYVSLLCSISDKPLEYWSKRQSQSGRIRKILDSDLLENVIEIQDFEQPNGFGTSILCPSDTSQFLNIELPILVVVIKNLNLQCRLQVQVLDTQNCPHHFQFSNSECEKQNSKGVICRVKVQLETGWNKIELNLLHLTQAAFKCQYAVVQRLQVWGNCRLRRVYFIDKHYGNEEICPELYQGFLDSYMLKWGIHTIDKSTQTNTKRNKSRPREGQSAKGGPARQLSADNVVAGGTDRSAAKNPAARRTVDENLLRNLQIKTDMLVNDFFNRQSAKSPRALEFKQQTKWKHYALPVMNAKPKSFGSSAVSEDAFRRINILRTLTDTYVSNEEKRKEENAVKDIQENWRQRYFHQVQSLKDRDSSAQSMTRTMLERKPKSMLVLSERKYSSGK
ncbi:uncharacterized protein LOC143368427 [Andrena cerasifolii]|uniref:uncharacterized protein LOC143368427 n=1 Tax=Andrena cerasifolii TaxID=2819439 RepID=UPI004037A6C1